MNWLVSATLIVSMLCAFVVLTAILFRERRRHLSARTSELEMARRLTSALTQSETEARAIADTASELAASQEQVAVLEAKLAQSCSLEQKHGDAARRFASELSTVSLQLHEAEARIVELAARPDVVLRSLDHNSTYDMALLWRLEVSKATRLWRASVSTNPMTDPDPFDAAEDDARLAAEIYSSALREEIGVHVSVEWLSDPITDPALKVLVVAVANELIASAARLGDPARLIVSGGEAITMQLSSGDRSDAFDLTALDFESDIIELDSTDGLVVKLNRSAMTQ